ncbi:MAG: 23S rRNA (adenine(2503)-C(2))-methyltransferase RlmN [bacterium]|nr:23S rRNA (adenine(2503)-C(2))-methyltransferase RlmN [bacterium]
MNIDKIKKVIEDEPTYRMGQVWHAIFVDLIDSWDKCTTLPKKLRETLETESPVKIDGEVFGSESSRSLKALITLEDGEKIEAVLLLHRDGRRTVCVSSQVGCAMGCKFCATGKMGRERNLTVGEIVEQVLFFARYLRVLSKENNRVTNVVFMGMGEPFLNYDNVMSAIRILNDDDGLNIGARHISVSTCGLVDGINKFAREPLQINLAISLHAPNDELRTSLMPVNRLNSLDDLMTAVRNYTAKSRRQVMFEYMMIDGVNDKEVHAKELIALLMSDKLFVVNLIRYNPTGSFSASSASSINKFKNLLMRAGTKVTQRQAFGADIKAACGQLATQKRNK